MDKGQTYIDRTVKLYCIRIELIRRLMYTAMFETCEWKMLIKDKKINIITDRFENQ